ncbi:MAG: L-aspartate oxidase [Chthonomonas sp.]|nr:L-aspartate oxidase [Chthonomonas sp.]
MIAADLSQFDQVVDAPVLVAGSGIAGLSVALRCAGRGVHVLTRRTLFTGGSSFWAQGGMAAAVGHGDSAKLHEIDTIAAGAGLTDPGVARVLSEQASTAVNFLRDLGANFDLTESGDLALGREAAHQRPRILHANKDATGAELMRALIEGVHQHENIRVHEDVLATELALNEQGDVIGLVARQQHRLLLFRSSAVVLATGGIGQLYRFTTNPVEARGDGLAIAARAGAMLTDLEFVQFHPTALLTPVDPLPLITEALRGAGAVLVNKHGERFMVPIHPDAELAPRDIVARGVADQIALGNRPSLDARAAIGERFPDEFPNIFAQCQSIGLDPRTELIPVAPACHYHMGGIDVTLSGQSSLRGLWACGEVSSTGVHGANRLASNSLLEAVVFGARVAEDILVKTDGVVASAPVHLPYSVPMIRDMMTSPVGETSIATMREVMWDKVGLNRNEVGLNEACRTFSAILELSGNNNYGVANRALTGLMMAKSALERRESRGAHFRSDHPQSDDLMRRHSRLAWNQTASVATVSLEDRMVEEPA